MKLKNFFKPRRVYPPILPASNVWPVVQLNRNRKQFIEQVIDETVAKINRQTSTPANLKEEIETTLFREKLRIKRNPWRVDPPDENEFWDAVRQRLVNISSENREVNQVQQDILREIIRRYANEIAGNFNRSSYKFARAVVTFGFARLLNAFNVQGFGSSLSTRLTLQDKIEIKGEAEQIRQLAKTGTIVMVPTHFSNLDSVLIGWAIHFLGLPAFIYGAGLNLFNIRIFAYFMNSLGAYKVDRRKKNLLYLETLKTNSSLALRMGCHSLFFPGGARSRSGRIEERLKLGLLGTAVEAQRILLQNRDEHYRKIYIVPVVINYHFVLEAPLLIKQYLQLKGQERFYMESDEYSTSYKLVKFMLKFVSKGSSMSLSIGKAMDLFGNYVDGQGASINKNGEVIDIQDYFVLHGEISDNEQRENEYTRRMSKIIVKEYLKINRVFSSHLVAFVAFEMIKNKFNKLDLYNILRLPEEELNLPFDEFCLTCEIVRNQIIALAKEGNISYADHLMGDIEKVAKHGVNNVGMYHAKRPLWLTRNKQVTSHDLTTLYYYRNRLEGYELDKFIK